LLGPSAVQPGEIPAFDGRCIGFRHQIIKRSRHAGIVPPASIGHRVNRHTRDTINPTDKDTTVQYCPLMHYQEGGEIGLTEEDMAPARAAFARYADDLDAAGVLIGTHVLQSAVATTTYTARNGTPEMQDGPFADTKERLGGVFVIDVLNLDAALSWAKRTRPSGTVTAFPSA
jgi:hypothetical protein